MESPAGGGAFGRVDRVAIFRFFLTLRFFLGGLFLAATFLQALATALGRLLVGACQCSRFLAVDVVAEVLGSHRFAPFQVGVCEARCPMAGALDEI